MKAMWSAFAVIIIVAVIASFALERSGFSAAERAVGPNVRLN